MRIAYLTQSQQMESAVISVQHGHQVLIIAASDREYPYHTYKDNVTILHLRSINNPFRGGERLLFFPRRAILGALTTFKPDVIHTDGSSRMGRIGLAYLQKAVFPAVLRVNPGLADASLYQSG